jgi:hypothetical protein
MYRNAAEICGQLEAETVIYRLRFHFPCPRLLIGNRHITHVRYNRACKRHNRAASSSYRFVIVIQQSPQLVTLVVAFVSRANFVHHRFAAYAARIGHCFAHFFRLRSTANYSHPVAYFPRCTPRRNRPRISVNTSSLFHLCFTVRCGAT